LLPKHFNSKRYANKLFLGPTPKAGAVQISNCPKHCNNKGYANKWFLGSTSKAEVMQINSCRFQAETLCLPDHCTLHARGCDDCASRCKRTPPSPSRTHTNPIIARPARLSQPTDRHPGKQSGKQECKQAVKQAGKQSSKQVGKQAGKQ